MVLDKYQKEQMKELQSLTEEELQICLKRLLKAMELLCPHLLEEFKDYKTTKKDMVKSVFTFRNIVIRKLQECFIGRRSKLQLCQEVHELLQGVKPYDVATDNYLVMIKNHFENSIPDVDLMELNDVLKRLYDIDSELFPGIPNVASKDSRKLKAGEILEEITYLRLAISSSMVFMTGSWEDLKHTIESDIDRWNVMKKIEFVMLNSDLVEINKDLIDTERNLLLKVLKNCKRFKAMDEEKLRKAFMEIKQISCRNMAETFDMGDNMKYFDKITTKGGKIQILCEEVETIINSFKRKFDADESSESLADKYIKLELLLEDMEGSLSENNHHFQQSWIYCLYEKVKEIKLLISNDQNLDYSKSKSMRNHIMEWLQEFKQWININRDLQTKSFARLNKAVRRLNNITHHDERKIKLSSIDDGTNSDDWNDEMKAFEKSFIELEDRINEIDVENGTRGSYGKIIEGEIMNKTEEDLKRLIIAMNVEMADHRMNGTDMNEMEAWLNGKSKEQLREDCQSLTHRLLVKKLNGFLNDNLQEAANNQSLRFDNDLSSKLMKFEDVNDFVEKSKVNQLYSNENNFSPDRNKDVHSGYSSQTRSSSRDPVQSNKARKPNHSQHDDIYNDFYYQKKLDDIQNYVARSNGNYPRYKDPNLSTRNLYDSDILVDGFEIEDEKTSRYYSMKLQDIQHERKEDELGAILHHMEQQRNEILDKNQSLQQQVFASQNLINNLQKKLDHLEKSIEILKQKKRSTEAYNDDPRLLRDETKWLSGRLLAAQQQLDHQNSELIKLNMVNDNLRQENVNMSIKNKYLHRSFKKLEEIFEDLCRQLDGSKIPQYQYERSDYQLNMNDSDLERLLRQSEMDKMELVKKLDILESQNTLLKEHCEKLDIELLKTNRSLSESQSLADNYLKQAKQLTDMLDGMQYENERYQTVAISPLIKGKDEEIKRLKIKVQHLENKIMMDNQI